LVTRRVRNELVSTNARNSDEFFSMCKRKPTRRRRTKGAFSPLRDGDIHVLPAITRVLYLRNEDIFATHHPRTLDISFDTNKRFLFFFPPLFRHSGAIGNLRAPPGYPRNKISWSVEFFGRRGNRAEIFESRHAGANMARDSDLDPSRSPLAESRRCGSFPRDNAAEMRCP